jgi:hypothetical protein
MTHDKLLAKIDETEIDNWIDSSGALHPIIKPVTAWQHALRSVVEAHTPRLAICDCHSDVLVCTECGDNAKYPCHTVRAIEQELK